MVLGNQVNVMSRQTEILEKSAVPNLAEVVVTYYFRSLDESNLITFSQRDIARGEAHVDFYFQNIGRLNTGPLTSIHFKSKPEWLDDIYYYFSNIKPGEINRTEIYFRVVGWYNAKEENYLKVSTGLHDVTLAGDCVYCDPHLFRKKFKICIYGGDYPEENCKNI